jgi:hypothetical protein
MKETVKKKEMKVKETWEEIGRIRFEERKKEEN